MSDKQRIIYESDLYTWITRGTAPLVIHVSEMKALADPDIAESGLLFLDYMVTMGFAARHAAGYRIPDPQAARTLLSLSTVLDQEATIPASLSAPLAVDCPAPGDLVVSVPLSLKAGLSALRARRTDIRVWDLHTALGALISSAAEEVLLTLPFLEEDGLGFLVDAIACAGKRGAALKVLGRGLLRPELHVHPFRHSQRLRAFGKVVDTYRTAGGSRVEVRDFTRQLVTGAHYEGIHQKMVVVDGSLAYTGSGEVRLASFLNNGEAGVIHGQPAAAFWKEFFYLFWAGAAPVSY